MKRVYILLFVAELLACILLAYSMLYPPVLVFSTLFSFIVLLITIENMIGLLKKINNCGFTKYGGEVIRLFFFLSAFNWALVFYPFSFGDLIIAGGLAGILLFQIISKKQIFKFD